MRRRVDKASPMANTVDLLTQIGNSLGQIARQQYDFQQKVSTYMDTHKDGGRSDRNSETIRIAVSGQGDAVLQAIISGKAGEENIRNLADGIRTLSDNLDRFANMKVVSDTGAMSQISEFVHKLASLNIDDVIALGAATEKQDVAFSSIYKFLNGIDAISNRAEEVNSSMNTGNIQAIMDDLQSLTASANRLNSISDPGTFDSLTDYMWGLVKFINRSSKDIRNENVSKIQAFISSVNGLLDTLSRSAEEVNNNASKFNTFFQNLSDIAQWSDTIVDGGGMRDFRRIAQRLVDISDDIRDMSPDEFMALEGVFGSLANMSVKAKEIDPQAFTSVVSSMESLSEFVENFEDVDGAKFAENTDKIIASLMTFIQSVQNMDSMRISEDAFHNVNDAFMRLYPTLEDITEKTKKLNTQDLQRLGDFLEILYQVTDDYNRRERGIQAFDITPLIRSLDLLTKNDFPKRIKNAASVLKGKTGVRLREFITEMANMMDSLSGKGEDIDRGINGIVKMLNTLSEPKMVMGVRFASVVLNEKSGRNISKFLKELCDGVGQIQNAKEVAEVLKSVNGLIDSIGWLVLKLAVIGMGILLYRPIETLATMGVLMLGVRFLLMSVVAAANRLDTADKALSDLNETITRLGIMLGVLAGISIMIRWAFGAHPGDFIGIVFGLVVGTILTVAAIVVAGMILQNSMKPIRDLTMAVAMLGLFIFSLSLSAVIIKEVGWISLLIVPLLILGVLATLAGVFFLLSKMSPAIKEGQIAIEELAKGIAMLILLSLGMALLVPLSEQISNGIWLFAMTSLVFIGITFLMRLAMGGSNGTEWLKAVSALVLGMLALTLIITYLLVPLAYYWETALIGLGLLAVMIVIAAIFAVAIRYAFGGENGAAAVRGAAVMGLFMFALSLSVLIVVLAAQLAQTMPWDGFIRVGIILVGIFVSLAIVALIARSGLLSNAQMKSVGAIILLMLGLLTVIGLTVLLSQYANQADVEGLKKMAFILGALLVTLGVLALISVLVKSTGAVKNVAILEALLVGLVGIIYLTIIVADKAKNTSWEGMGQMGLILLALLGTLTVLGTIGFFLTSNPIGIAALASIGVILALMGGLVLVIAGFVGVLGKYMALKSEYGELTDAGKSLGKDFGGFIEGVASGFSGMGFKTALIMGFLADKLKPLVAACGNFVDIVSKVATLRFADEWDPETGKPTHYTQLDRDAFMTASNMISDGFSKFVTGLKDSFGQLGWRSMAAIDYLSDSIGPLMKAVGKFTDAVVKLATGTYKVTDDNGNTVYKHVSTNDMVTAAVAVSVGFSMFVTELTNSIRNLDDDVEDALEALSDNIGPIMRAVGDFTEAVIKLATGTYTITGEDGKSITKQFEPGAYGKAAQAVGDNFSTFIKTLLERLKDLDGDAEDAMEELSENIGPIMKAVSDFSNAISKFTDPGKLQLVDHYDENGKPVYSGKMVDVNAAARNLAKCFTSFVGDIVREFSRDEISNKIDDVMELMDKLDPMTKAFKKFADVVMDSVENEAYTKAIEVSMFLSTGMRTAIETLNGTDNFIFGFGTPRTKTAVKYIIDSVVAMFKSFGEFEKFGQIDLEKIITREKDYIRLMKVFMEVDMTNNSTTLHRVITFLCGDLRTMDAKFLASKEVITDFSVELDKSLRQIDASLRRGREERKAVLEEFASSMKKVGDQIEYINKAVEVFNSKDFDKLKELAQAMSDAIAESAANISAQILVNSGVASGGTNNSGERIQPTQSTQNITNNYGGNGTVLNNGGTATKNITIELGDTEVVKLRGLLRML